MRFIFEEQEICCLCRSVSSTYVIFQNSSECWNKNLCITCFDATGAYVHVFGRKLFSKEQVEKFMFFL
jgi:hypothetical protein